MVKGKSAQFIAYAEAHGIEILDIKLLDPAKFPSYQEFILKWTTPVVKKEKE